MRSGQRALTLFDWVRVNDAELRVTGNDPRQRFAHIGHSAPLGESWLGSLGLWGGRDTREMIDEVAPHQAVVPVSASAFRKFKSRQGLKSRRQFVLSFGPHVWARAEVSFVATEDVQRRIALANEVRAPLGVAADYARCAAHTRGRSLGMLPVEIVIWSRVFQEALDHAGIDLELWRELDVRDRALVWSADQRPVPERFEAWLHRVPSVARSASRAVKCA